MDSNVHKQMIMIKNAVEKQEKSNEVIYINDFISKGGFTLQDIGDDKDE